MASKKDGSAQTATAPWIVPATREELAEALFHFLVSLGDGRPEAPRPLVAETEVFAALCREPPADLVEALRRFLESFFAGIDPDLPGGQSVALAPSVWAWSLVVYDSVSPLLPHAEESIQDFHRSLVACLTPARSTIESLTCHALLDAVASMLPELPSERAAVVQDLLLLEPLSAVVHLDVHTPPALLGLAEELLPGNALKADPAPWSGLDDWLETLLPVLAMPAMARHLRQRWLAVPETRLACRNLGLLLEALRRRGWRDFVLEVYEAYDTFAAVTTDGPNGPPRRHWPVLGRIARLLECGGGSEAAFRLYQWGNEYFLKFRPLVEITTEEQGVPRDFRYLSRELLVALRPLQQLTP